MHRVTKEQMTRMTKARRHRITQELGGKPVRGLARLQARTQL
jgi:hypothetical protein